MSTKVSDERLQDIEAIFREASEGYSNPHRNMHTALADLAKALIERTANKEKENA